MVALSVLSFLLIYRNYGGYYYRANIAKIVLFSVSVYGFIIACILTPLRCTHLINYSVAKVARALSRFWTGLEVDCEGLEHLDDLKGPAIYVCNHQSSLDVLLIGTVYQKNTSIVAKKALKYYPFLGWFSKFFYPTEMIPLLTLTSDYE
jgi:lysophosphatidate acyltransferase